MLCPGKPAAPLLLVLLFYTCRIQKINAASTIFWRTLLQEDIESKIEVADALAIKLLQRFNNSVSAMKTTSQNLSEGTWQDIKL